MSSNSEDIQIGQRLAAVRKRNGMTQQGFADAIGVPLRTYQNYERGDRPVSKEVICALAELYQDVDLTWLLTGRGGRTIASTIVDADLLLDIIRELRSEDGRLHMMREERLLPYAVMIYNEVFHIEEESPRRQRVSSLIRLVINLIGRQALESALAFIDSDTANLEVKTVNKVMYAPIIAERTGRSTDEVLQDVFSDPDVPTELRKRLQSWAARLKPEWEELKKFLANENKA